MKRLRDAGKEQEAATLDRVVIEAQGHKFTVKVTGLPEQGGGKRGKVNGFSNASRKRLLNLLAGLEPEKLDGFRYVGLFVTLTYAGDEADLPDPETVKQDLDSSSSEFAGVFPRRQVSGGSSGTARVTGTITRISTLSSWAWATGIGGKCV